MSGALQPEVTEYLRVPGVLRPGMTEYLRVPGVLRPEMTESRVCLAYSSLKRLSSCECLEYFDLE